MQTKSLITAPPRTKLGVAQTYYRLFSAFWNIGLTDSEVLIMSYMSISSNGVITGMAKKKFREKFNTSEQSMYNAITRLKKKKVLVRQMNGKKGITVIPPKIMIDFNNNSFKFEFECALKEMSIQMTE